MMKRIEEYEIINHGIHHPDYFQGCGISKFTDIATGTGCSESQALEDALDQLAQGDWDTEANNDLNADCDKADTTDIVPITDVSLWVYISVRVR